MRFAAASLESFINIMKTILLSLLLIFPLTVTAEAEKGAYEKYNMEKRVANTVKINIVTTQEDITVACNKEAKRRGTNLMPAAVEACSFWGSRMFRGRVCTIIIPVTANNDSLGHEVHHCFVGRFHD